MASVTGISGTQALGALNQNAGNKVTGYGFQDTLNSMLSQINTQLQDTDRLTQEFALGNTDSIHEVMIETEKSGISLSFLLQIRTKLLEAYQEIMRMNF
jgi:flagellar hook-basal body complex protein FliE